MRWLTLVVAVCAIAGATRTRAACPGSAASSAALIRIETSLERTLSRDFNKDPLSVMPYFAADTVMYDVMPGDEHGGLAISPSSLAAHLQQIAPHFVGTMRFLDMQAHACGDVGFISLIQRFEGKDAHGQKLVFTLRATDGFQQIGGAWKIVHEHISLPVDMATGAARFDSKF